MRSPHLPTLALSLTAASTIAHQTASFAQAIPESARITPVTAIEGATFGNRISIDDDWMAIGADFDAEVLGRGFVEIHRDLLLPSGSVGSVRICRFRREPSGPSVPSGFISAPATDLADTDRRRNGIHYYK